MISVGIKILHKSDCILRFSSRVIRPNDTAACAVLYSYVCVYVSVWVCVYVCMYVCVYMCVCVRITAMRVASCSSGRFRQARVGSVRPSIHVRLLVHPASRFNALEPCRFSESMRHLPPGQACRRTRNNINNIIFIDIQAGSAPAGEMRFCCPHLLFLRCGFEAMSKVDPCPKSSRRRFFIKTGALCRLRVKQ